MKFYRRFCNDMSRCLPTFKPEWEDQSILDRNRELLRHVITESSIKFHSRKNYLFEILWFDGHDSTYLMRRPEPGFMGEEMRR